MDLRDRVVAACDSGEWPQEEVAEEFGVSTSWIRRLRQRRRESGDYKPKQGKRGRKPVFSGSALAHLDRLVAEQPDATLEELRDRTGAACSLVTMSNTLKRLGYRRKKRHSGRLSKTGRT
jgi:transposase